jgi:hypothetical protein
MLKHRVTIGETNMTQNRTAAERRNLIVFSLEAAYNLGFTLPERAKLHGYSEDAGEDPDHLFRQLVELGKGEAVEERCEAIIALDHLLEIICGPNVTAKRRYFETEKFIALNDETLKDWFRDGDLVRMEFAVNQLRQICT